MVLSSYEHIKIMLLCINFHKFVVETLIKLMVLIVKSKFLEVFPTAYQGNEGRKRKTQERV